MLKKITLLLMLCFFWSCGYEALYLKKDDLKKQINVITLNGDQKINKMILSSLGIKEDKNWILEIAIPGLTKEDLKVKMIKGELSIASTNEDNVWLGSFDKRFTLPQDVNSKKIKAKVENGVLSLTLPIKDDSENFIDIK